MEFMNKERLAIAKIARIETIHFYDLYDRSNSDKERKNCIGLLVFFDGGILNYCELDPEYEFFKRKVINQYKIEKTNFRILMDEQTKTILENSEVELEETTAHKYLDSKSFNTKLINYKEKRFLQIEDILIYYIKQMYTLLGYRCDIDSIKSGIGENYSIGATLTDKDNIKSFIEVPISLEEKDNFEYIVKIGNIIQSINYLSLHMVFKDNKIDVNLLSEDYSFSYRTGYRIRDNKLLLEALIIREEETIFYDNDLIDSVLEPEEIEMIKKYISIEGKDINNYGVVKLPWGGYFLHSKTRKENGPRFDLTDSSSIYISVRDTYANLKHYSEKGVMGQQDLTHSRIDGLIKNLNIYLVGGKRTKYAICETSFGEASYAIGLYKKELANKNYYDAFRTNVSSLKAIENPILHPVNLDLEPNQGYKLFEEETLADVVKRGKR